MSLVPEGCECLFSAAAPEAGDDTLLQQGWGNGKDAAAGQLPSPTAAQPQARLHLLHSRLDRHHAHNMLIFKD